MSIKLFSNNYPDFIPFYINQGKIGDCWLISTLLALSINKNGKDILKKMFIIDEKTGTYIIKLYDETKKLNYININPKFKIYTDINNKQQLVFCGNKSNIPELFNLCPDTNYIWGPIIEKAIHKFTKLTKGSYAYKAFSLFTDKYIHKIYSYGLNKRTLEKFKNSHNNICCVIESKNDTTKLIKNHAYALLTIIDNKWYLQNPHDNYNELHNCIILDDDDIIKNVDIITYITF